MNILKIFLVSIFLMVLSTSCVSTKNTIKNIDNTALKPTILNNAFVITENASDGKYGYDKNWPINLGFDNEFNSFHNINYFFNALEGEMGEKISAKKMQDCCPFPTKRSTIGAGMLAVYEVSFEGKDKKSTLYFNVYDKGKIMCPKGFSIKNLKK